MMFLRSILLLALVLTVATPSRGAILSAPEYAVFDSSSLLSPGVKHALELILVEHERLGGGHVVLAIVPEAGKEKLDTFTGRLFSSWQIGRDDPTRGVLFVYFARESEGRIQTGFGLEDRLSEGQIRKILSNSLKPELRAGHPERAVTITVLDILHAIESPVLIDGKAQGILRTGGFQGDFVAHELPTTRGLWLFWVACGALCSVIAAGLLTSAEAHYTSSGWIHPKPWEGVRVLIRERISRKRTLPSSLGGTYGHW